VIHPYEGIADYRHWRRAPGAADPAALDPVTAPKFAIAADEPVATAGSCFAQHVMRHLRAAGLATLVSEPAPSILPEALATGFHYGIFSTRSGNIYTARQLAQLLARAQGRREPTAEPWHVADGVIDPFRPSVGPFASVREMEADRDFHLSRVRAMLEDMAVLVFTLGLTEAWLDEDGAVFPLAPGVAGGRYDPARHTFKNFTVEETVADLREALATIRAVNPAARAILTVSPVPLMATGVDRHVLVSTVYSKSVLRVAAQAVADGDPSVDYFPAYEIITAPHTRGRYFGPDARAVTETGVGHVMRLFLRHYCAVAAPDGEAGKTPRDRRAADARFRADAEALADAYCEEEALDPAPQRGAGD